MPAVLVSESECLTTNAANLGSQVGFIPMKVARCTTGVQPPETAIKSPSIQAASEPSALPTETHFTVPSGFSQVSIAVLPVMIWIPAALAASTDGPLGLVRTSTTAFTVMPACDRRMASR